MKSAHADIALSYSRALFPVPAALFVFFVVALPVPAAPLERAVLSSDSALNDCRLTVLARQALLQDELLAALNLGVSVRDHVAVLWGPIPSADLARRAVERVGNVQGIARVMNQLTIEAPGNPLVEFLKTPRPPRPAPPASVPGAEKRPRFGSLTGREGPEEATPAQGPLWHPTSSQEPTPERAANPRIALQGIGMPTPSNPSDMIGFMPFIAVPSSTDALTGAPLGGADRPAQAPGHELLPALEQLREGNDGLRHIQFAIQENTVYLRGSVPSHELLFRLARSISLLPGVERVVLEDVKRERR